MSWKQLLLLMCIWSFIPFIAGKTDCRHPAIDRNALVHYPVNITRRGPFREYSTLSFKCKPGFTHSAGQTSAVCINGTWQYIHNRRQRPNEPLRCQEKPCPVRHPENGQAFRNNKEVSYKCNSGYELIGTNASLCKLNTKTGNYYIEDILPTCKAIERECETPRDQHVIMHGDCCRPGNQLTFTCEPDYRLEGETSATCLNNGQWSRSLPNCIFINLCEEPGFSTNSNRTGDCCLVGSVLTYNCHDGYEFVDPYQQNPITCNRRKQWSYKTPKCKPIGATTCPDIPLAENNLILASIRDSDIYLPWDEVELDCLPNYASDAESLRPMCQENGQWDTAIPMCIPLNPCSRPPNIQNGKILELIDNKNQLFPIGFEINIECDDYYEMKSNRYGSRCVGNNVWENGISNCTLIACKNPGVPKNGMRHGDDFHVGKKVNYVCGGNMTLRGSASRTCLESKRWSGSTPVCDSGNTHCPDPGIPLNSKRKGRSFMVNDTVKYTCLANHLLIGNGTRICNQDGTWTGNEILCIAPDEYPDKAILAMELEGTITEIARMSPSSIPISRILRSGNGIDINDMKGVNLYFLFDGSGSITNKQFDQSKELAKALIRKIGISDGPGGIRVGAIVFSKNATVKVYPTTDKTVTVVVDKIHAMQREALGTNISGALECLLNLIATSKRNEDRKQSKDVMFLMTDGNVNEGGQPELQAKELHRLNIDVYVVAIGNEINFRTLLMITKNPKQILKMANHKELYNLFSRVVGKYKDYSACGLDRLQLAEEEVLKLTNRRKRSTLLSRVVGGEPAKFAWPWIAAVYFVTRTQKMFHCGGSIIHAKWILSAAHCFVAETRDGRINVDQTNLMLRPRQWIISLGRVRLDDPESGLNAFVSKIIIHENYDPRIYQHDIALIELVSWMQFDIFTRPICLPPPLKDFPQNANLYAAGKLATLIGWGHNKTWKIDDPLDQIKAVNHLNQLEMPLQAPEVCKRPVTYKYKNITYTTSVHESTMCAGTGKRGQDACKGDSGGPLMQFVRSNCSNPEEFRWFQVGIVSWGIGCGIENYYGYFTNLAMHRDWIVKSTKMTFETVLERP